MRLFVALPVSEPVRREVRRRAAGLRERLPRARWVEPDLIHVTLLFLGEVEPGPAASLAAALGGACAPFPEMSLRLAGAGTFPAGRPARVAWVGVAAPAPLAGLQAAVVAAARATLGETRETAPDQRPYRPHVTLARCPSPWPRGAAEKFVAAFPGEIGPPFAAGAVLLVESRLSPQGPRHRNLAELPLAGGGPAGEAADQEPADPGEP
jgi:2'-5' RNA ligase